MEVCREVKTVEKDEEVSSVPTVSADAADVAEVPVSAEASARDRRAAGVAKKVESGIDVPLGANTNTSSPGKSVRRCARAVIHRTGIISCCDRKVTYSLTKAF